MKKIFVGLLTLGAALVVIPMFAAFEAHVINVTAKIENALAVNTEAIEFGTVFPQEQLDQPLTVALSQSFIDEPRVDDVEYIIRQKPKCAWTINTGQQIVGDTQSGHVDDRGNITCPEPGQAPTTGAVWGSLPSLCEYISKHPDVTRDGGGNDDSLDSFHQPWQVGSEGLIWNDVNGYLTKDGNDTTDTWTIDLAVPCFGGYCAQDWADFVNEINPGTDASLYTQPISNEHKVFGCDLWVEVTGVSRD